MTDVDRRALLALGSAAALAGVVPAARRAAPAPQDAAGAKKVRKLEKALMWGMIGAGKNVLEKLELAKQAGFAGVELDSPTKEFTVDEALDALKRTGMRVADVVDSVHWSKPLSDPDPAVRDEGRAALEGALRDARRYGTDSVLLVPAVVHAKVSYAEAWERSTAEIRKVLPLAAELKVTISIENVWNHFLLSPLEAARYVDQFESPWVGWHMDMGNIVLYGWPEQWIQVLGQRIRRLHVKEYSRKKLDEQGRWKGFDAELGEGDCNWPAIVTALDAIGYTGWASAEVGGGGLDRLKDVSSRMDRILGL
jgi:hexulose-6-phosphate isomerase